MSMLADKRIRKKWCLNPQGNAWTNDPSQLGKKMLEKMGWKSGQGLGKNEQGIKESLKVKCKTDNAGLGFKQTEEVCHQKEYGQMLDDLKVYSDSSKHMTNSNMNSSLEEKSQLSRARVHYHKFTRGKDVSRYSPKDLKGILGKETTCNGLVKSSTNKSSQKFSVNQVNEQPQLKTENDSTSGIEICTVNNVGRSISEEHPSFKKKTKRSDIVSIPNNKSKLTVNAHPNPKKHGILSENKYQETCSLRKKKQNMNGNCKQKYIDELGTELSIQSNSTESSNELKFPIPRITDEDDDSINVKIKEHENVLITNDYYEQDFTKHIDFDIFCGSNIRNISGYGECS